MASLDGKRIILTGASSGIGRALAERLAGERSRLVLASRDRDRLESLATAIRRHGGEAHVVPTDVAEANQRAALIGAALARLGGLDVLVNNAGVGAMGLFEDASEDRLRRIFEVNFFGTTELTRLALPHLRRGSEPLIVNIGSVLGKRAIPGCTEYCASKFALTGWSEGLRAELAQEGIQVLLVSPGAIETSFHANLLEDRARFRLEARRRMSAERCANLIVRAMRRRQSDLVITGAAKAMVWLNRLAPRFLDRLLARYTPRAQQPQ